MFKLLRRWKYKKMLKYFQDNRNDFFDRECGGMCSYLSSTFPYFNCCEYKEIWNNRPRESGVYWFKDDDERIAYIENAIKLTYGT